MHFFHRASLTAQLGFLGIAALSAPSHAQTPAATSLKFDFGPGKVAPGYTQVLPTTLYSKEQGYGFEPGTTISGIDRGGADALTGDFCTSGQPFFFSTTVPPGNYNVTVVMGDQNQDSSSTIKAEIRRLMLEKVDTKTGKFETRTFTVNVRNPQISTGGQVKLKTREQASEVWSWDDKLTLEFNGPRPCICSVEITKAQNAPTVFVLGDSTVCDQPGEPYNSWGQMLPRFFKPGIAISNNAESGESLRSSLGARRLDKALDMMRPGDYMLVQFGHNDMKEKGEGVGAFTTYKTDLKKYVEGAKNKGGIPILVTSMNRRTFGPDGKITNSLGDYPEAVRQTAKEENVALIDLNAMSKLFYEALGREDSVKAFAPGDGTHHDNYGSYELAKCIVEGIKANQPDLAKFLTDDATTFDPSHPDPINEFKIPASPRTLVTKPEGS